MSYFPIFCHPWNVNQMKNGRRRKKGDFIWIYDFFPLWPDAVTSLLLVCIFAKRTICIFDWTCFYPRKDDHSGLKIGKIVQYFKGDTKWWKYDTWIRKENAEHVWRSHCQIIVISPYIFFFTFLQILAHCALDHLSNPQLHKSTFDLCKILLT